MSKQISAWVSSSIHSSLRGGFNASLTCEVRAYTQVSGIRTRRSEIVRQVSMTSDKWEKGTEWDGQNIDASEALRKIKFSADGLVAAVAQQYDTNEVLMVAWMNEESIRETLKQGRAVYYSRSRQQLWRKGDTSGQIQVLKDFVLDCDGDTLLLKVDQLGVACHTGRRSCFYTAFRPPYGKPQIIADVLMDPKELYGANTSSNRKLYGTPSS